MTGTRRRLLAAIWIVSWGAISSNYATAAPPRLVGPAGAQATRIAQRPYVPLSAVNPAAAQSVAAAAPMDVVSQASCTTCDDSGFADVGCDSGACGIGTPVCLSVWGNLEYLLWWSHSGSLPPLATTSPNGTPRDIAAVLGFDSTSILFGGPDGNDSESQSGARLTIGWWLDGCQSKGIFFRGFALGESEHGFRAQTDGSDILGRPFFNALTDEEDALLLGFPDAISGSMDSRYSSEASGLEILFRHLWRAECNYRIDMVYGYRYFNVDETLRIDNSLEFIDPSAITFGNTIDQTDRFAIENEFHGAELGIMGHSVDGRFTMDFLATVALGSMRERATISGGTVTTPANGGPVTTQGGLLTQNSNIGTFSEDEFTVVPEFTVNAGYFVTPRFDVSVGYTFIFVNHVQRAGDIIDPVVNLNQQTGIDDGPERPAYVARDGSYWLQGLNFGLNLRY